MKPFVFFTLLRICVGTIFLMAIQVCSGVEVLARFVDLAAIATSTAAICSLWHLVKFLSERRVRVGWPIFPMMLLLAVEELLWLRVLSLSMLGF